MDNGHSDAPQIIKPPVVVPPKETIVSLTCHRFYAPVVFPEPDRLDPRKANITPRLGNFNCIGDKCTLWNKEAQECRDVTDSKSRAMIADYCYGKMNDVHISEGAS